MVLTGTEKYPNLNRATGVWLGEVVHFVKAVEKAGFGVDYVSPQGGYTPMTRTALPRPSRLTGNGITTRDS